MHVCKKQPFIDKNSFFRLYLARIHPTEVQKPRILLEAEPSTRLERHQCPVAELQRDLITRALPFNRKQKTHLRHPHSRVHETKVYLCKRCADGLAHYFTVCLPLFTLVKAIFSFQRDIRDSSSTFITWPVRSVT